MRRSVAALFHGRGIVFVAGIEMTLLGSSHTDFGLPRPLPPSIHGEPWVHQNVACSPGTARPKWHARAISGGRSSDRQLRRYRRAGPRGNGDRLVPALIVLRSGKASICRFADVERGRRLGHALSQLHPSVHTRLKVSSCAVLTLSRNSGNNLQLSEKCFDGWKLRLREFRRRRAAALSVEQ